MGLQPLGLAESEEMKDIADQVEIKEFPGVPVKYAFKTIVFWMILIVVITNSFATGFNQHWVNLGVTSGFDLVKAATLATIAMLSSAILKIVSGWAFDKFGVMKSAVILTLCGIVAMILLMVNTGNSFAIIQVACIFFGGAVTITTSMPPMAIREMFGMRDYASIYPVAFMGMSFGTGLTYGLHGFFIQLTGSYFGSFVFNLICYIVGLLAMFIVLKFAKPMREKYWREVGQAL
jgi:MFS family permease